MPTMMLAVAHGVDVVPCQAYHAMKTEWLYYGAWRRIVNCRHALDLTSFEASGSFCGERL
jgi:hypothetical protein